MTTDKQYRANNYVELTGNTGAETQEHLASDGKQKFATLSLYTQSSYFDKDQETWVNNPSILHNVIAFKPWVIAQLKSFKQGARIKITGEIRYRPFKTVLEDGSEVTKHEAAIFAESVELAALYTKVNKPEASEDSQAQSPTIQ